MFPVEYKCVFNIQNGLEIIVNIFAGGSIGQGEKKIANVQCLIVNGSCGRAV